MKVGVSYFGNRIPEHFAERDLPEIVEMGCTFVLHTFSEHDMQYYPDAVREMVRRSKEAGLEVYVDPWGVAGVFGGEAYSRFLLDYPEAWQVRRSGVRIPMACPNSHALHGFMERWTDTASGLGADVLFWDEPHFVPEDANAGGDGEGCHCEICAGLFQEHHGKPMHDAGPPDLLAFQEDTAVRFIDMLCRAGSVHGLRNAVCLLPFDNERQGPGYWERVAAIPELDILGVTPFWHLRGQEVRSYVGSWARRIQELSDRHAKEPQVWLQAFLISEGREDELEAAATVACDAGVRNMGAWGFRACAHMAPLRPERPEAVWGAVHRTFASLRSGR